VQQSVTCERAQLACTGQVSVDHDSFSQVMCRLGCEEMCCGYIGTVQAGRRSARKAVAVASASWVQGLIFLLLFCLHLSLQSAALLPMWCSHSCSWTLCLRFRRVTACDQHNGIQEQHPPTSAATQGGSMGSRAKALRTQPLPSRRLTRVWMCSLYRRWFVPALHARGSEPGFHGVVLCRAVPLPSCACTCVCV
jgi:hypothetical protein